MTRRFCVLTTGRTGSTALIAALGVHADIAIPFRNWHRKHTELLHPKVVEDNRRHLESMTGRSLPTADDVVDAFYTAHDTAAYAGFKLMPWQHPAYLTFARRTDVRFIVLRRRDFASMVASWFIAHRFGSWELATRKVVTSWTFGRGHVRDIRNHLLFILRNQYWLDQVEGAIVVNYEDLCRPDTRSAELDDFFQRPVALERPLPATDARSYVRNWTDFAAFVERERERMQPRLYDRMRNRSGPLET